MFKLTSRIIIFFGLLYAVATHAQGSRAPIQPKIIPSARDVGKIDLGDDIKAALSKFNPHFQIYKAKDFIPDVRTLFLNDNQATPMAVLGDFNRDKITDVALLGHDGTEEIALALVSEAGAYQVKVIERTRYRDPSQVLYPPIGIDTEEVRQQGLFRYLSPGMQRHLIQTEVYKGVTKAFYLDPEKGFLPYRE